MIPKLIHFIWVGNQNLPTYFQKFIENWKSVYQDYKFFIWDDDKISKENLVPEFLKSEFFNNNFKAAYKADILRYLIINKYGGLYFDVDFECIKRIPDTFLNFKFLGGIQNNGEIAIGFFASVPNNELLNKVIELIPESVESAKINGFYRSDCIHKITGPEFFNRIAKKYFNKDDYFFFTKEYFYPYWFDEPHRKNENFEVTSPISYSVHHWESSWK